MMFNSTGAVFFSVLKYVFLACSFLVFLKILPSKGTELEYLENTVINEFGYLSIVGYMLSISTVILSFLAYNNKLVRYIFCLIHPTIFSLEFLITFLYNVCNEKIYSPISEYPSQFEKTYLFRNIMIHYVPVVVLSFDFYLFRFSHSIIRFFFSFFIGFIYYYLLEQFHLINGYYPYLTLEKICKTNKMAVIYISVVFSILSILLTTLAICFVNMMKSKKKN